MALLKLNFILILLIIGCINQIKSQCVNPFNNGDVNNICYYYDETSLSWLDGYNQCLSPNINGILIEIFSIEQFNMLKNLNIDNSLFWLGANNFATFVDSQWHWLDGSIVNDSVVKWCPNSTYDTAIGTYCAAYDSVLNCITNYLCNTLLPTPCVATTNFLLKQEKSILTSRTSSSGGTCTNAYGGAYANWWTYSILLLNWFILLCFILYMINRLDLNRFIIIITIVFIIISFMIIITFSILWGVQYQNILQIPLIMVILGCIASLLFLINILIFVSNRTRVERWMACMIVTIITIVLESSLMLGLILCIAYCSGYISLVSTVIDKDIIASLLASIITAISIIFYNGIIYLLGYTGQNRIHVDRSIQPNVSIPLVTNQNQHNKIERATSPVDQRIINEFYSDQPKDMHKYQLDGRNYVVYEGNTYGEIDPYRKDLTQAMLTQERQGLQESIIRVKSSPHAAALAEEIHQAENLLKQLE